MPFAYLKFPLGLLIWDNNKWSRNIRILLIMQSGQREKGTVQARWAMNRTFFIEVSILDKPFQTHFFKPNHAVNS